MNKLLVIFFASIVCISCKKEMPIEPITPTTDSTIVQHASVERILVNPSATIDSVKYKPVYSGSNMSIQFSIFLSNVVNVKDVQLYLENFGQMYKITNAKNGVNILYDRLTQTYPTGPQRAFYYFIITLNDGTVLTSDKFQVY